MQDRQTNRQSPRWRRRAILAVAIPALLVGANASAQTIGSTDTVRPVSILAGDCLTPGTVVAELSDLVVGPNDRGTLEFVGASGAAVVEESESTVQSASLGDLTGSPHVLVVQESEASDTVIACGDHDDNEVDVDIFLTSVTGDSVATPTA